MEPICLPYSKYSPIVIDGFDPQALSRLRPHIGLPGLETPSTSDEIRTAASCRSSPGRLKYSSQDVSAEIFSLPPEQPAAKMEIVARATATLEWKPLDLVILHGILVPEPQI